MAAIGELRGDRTLIAGPRFGGGLLLADEATYDERGDRNKHDSDDNSESAGFHSLCNLHKLCQL